jgi:phage N-6-adenine-methyltransferase
MNNALMFSKASDEWSTPQDFWNLLDAEFYFALDAAASAENAKVGGFFSIDDDALVKDWFAECHGYRTVAVWLNPPYSKCREFIGKAATEGRKGCTVVCLVPSRTDTRWFHEHVWNVATNSPRPGVEVRFVKGRLRFGGGKDSAPFPSVVIIFRPVQA